MMHLPAKLLAPVMQRTQLGTSISVLMTIFVYLVTLGIAIQAIAISIPMHWQNQLRHALTLELSPASDDKIRNAADAEAIRMQLQALPEVLQARLVDEREAVASLSPILAKDHMAELILPALIEVTLTDGDNALPEFQAKLANLSTGIRLLDQKAQADDLATWVRRLGIVAAVIVIATLLAQAIAIGLISRLALAMQAQTIDLLHILGAKDDEIAGQFARLIQSISLPAALLGFVLASCTLILLGMATQLPVASTLNSPAGVGALVLALVAAPLLALATAQFASKAALVAKLRLMP